MIKIKIISEFVSVDFCDSSCILNRCINSIDESMSVRKDFVSSKST